MRRFIRDESGQVAPIVAVSLLGLMAIVGLVVDGGLMFSARRNIQATVDAAARAGAMSIDEDEVRASGGDNVRLDGEAAEIAVRRYLAEIGFAGSIEVAANAESVTVRLSEERATILLSLVGIGQFDAAASATARPRSGT